MQGLLAEERGSARIAVAIATGVLAILAVFAVPMVFSQSHSAQDLKARSAVTKLARQVEACRVTADSYGDCDEAGELKAGSGIRWGRHAGDSGVLVEESTRTGFTAYAVSGSGAGIYVWYGRDGQATRHMCTHGSVDRLQRRDCDGRPW